jgi:hypothetical protein
LLGEVFLVDSLPSAWEAKEIRTDLQATNNSMNSRRRLSDLRKPAANSPVRFIPQEDYFGAHPKGTSFGAHPKGTSFGAYFLDLLAKRTTIDEEIGTTCP